MYTYVLLLHTTMRRRPGHEALGPALGTRAPPGICMYLVKMGHTPLATTDKKNSDKKLRVSKSKFLSLRKIYQIHTEVYQIQLDVCWIRLDLIYLTEFMIFGTSSFPKLLIS